MEGVFLKGKEQRELQIIYKASSGQMSRKEARTLLQVSERTVGRLIAQFRAEGISYIVHGNRNRAPANRTSDDVKKRVLTLVREKYFDFNMTHALQMILEETGVRIPRETFRRWVHSEGMVKHPHRRRTPPRYRRERMSKAGFMVMMDGSYHRWFADVESCLILALDDATSEILWAEFYYGAETTVSCMEVLRNVVLKRGSFRVLYVDQAGAYGGIKRSGFSQVERAMGELHTQVIYAQSPEAKGRIERLFRTLQDRLIPVMRLKGIRNLKDANRYLREEFIPHEYNGRFTCQAEDPNSAFTPLHASVDLDSIFCVKEYRQVARDHTISVAGERYLIDENLKYSIHGQKLELRWNQKGESWQAYFAGRPIRLVAIKRAQKISA